MIREATIDDIPSIVKLIRQGIPETYLKYAKVGFSPSKSANLAKCSIDQGYAWVYERQGVVVGMLLAEKRLNIFSDRIIEACVNALFIDRDSRATIGTAKLIKAFLSKCDEQNIKMVWFGCNVHSNIKETTMNKLGFKLQEKFYLKETI